MHIVWMLDSALDRWGEWHEGAVERHPWVFWAEVALFFVAFGLLDGALGGEVM